MKTKENKSKTVKVKTKPVKKNIDDHQFTAIGNIAGNNNSSVEEQHVEQAILENNINNSSSRTLDYQLKSGRIFAAPCSDELFTTLSRRAKLEYLDFCCRNNLKLSDIQDNFY